MLAVRLLPRRLARNRIRMGAIATIAAALLAAAPAAAADVEEAGPILAVPASSVELHIAAPLPDGVGLSRQLRLVEVDRPDVVVAAQLVPAIAGDGSAGRSSGRLIAAIAPRKGAAGKRRFRVETAAAADGKPRGFRFQDVSGETLGMWENNEPVLAYNHGVITSAKVPADDHRRSRACYVHPLWGLHGETLTDDFPKDHYHHHGVFWTWPHVRIQDKEYDLWAGPNIHDRFVRWICREAGPIAAVLAVENGWFVGDQKVMIERVWLRAHQRSNGQRALDLELVWIPQGQAVTLWGAEGKSYGGLTIRFAPFKERPAITVPSGRTKEDLKEAPLAWADFTAQFSGAPAPSGAAVFVHPAHPEYPPTWLTRHYGCLCVGWPGIRSKTFQPGEPFRLSYRILIHEAAAELVDLQKAYEAYGAAAKAAWE